MTVPRYCGLDTHLILVGHFPFLLGATLEVGGHEHGLYVYSMEPPTNPELHRVFAGPDSGFYDRDVFPTTFIVDGRGYSWYTYHSAVRVSFQL